MELNVKELSASEKEIEVTLTYDEIKNDIETEIKKQSKNIQLPGFRKGKVPMNIIKKRYGDALEYEASEKIANQHFWKIADDKQLNPIGRPVMTDIQFSPGEDLHFKVKYEVMPAVEVKDYTGQTIEIPEFKVSQEEVEKEINHIRRANRTFEDADVVEDNNYLLDVELFKLNESGEPETEEGEKMQIDLSSDDINKEILEKSQGKKTGDSFTFGFDDVRTFKNAKGEDEESKVHYDYKVVISKIQKIIEAELTEELVKKVTKDKVSNEEDLRKEIEKDIQHYFDHQNEELLKSKLISKIIENNDFTPPATLVENILDQLVKNEEEYMKKQGVKNVNTDELRERYKKTAENDVKWFILKQEIIKKENISFTDEELKEMAEKEAEKTGISVEKLLNFYKSSGQNEKNLDKKLFGFLEENNEIKKLKPQDFAKLETKEEK